MLLYQRVRVRTTSCGNERAVCPTKSWRSRSTLHVPKVVGVGIWGWVPARALVATLGHQEVVEVPVRDPVLAGTGAHLVARVGADQNLSDKILGVPEQVPNPQEVHALLGVGALCGVAREADVTPRSPKARHAVDLFSDRLDARGEKFSQEVGCLPTILVRLDEELHVVGSHPDLQHGVLESPCPQSRDDAVRGPCAGKGLPWDAVGHGGLLQSLGSPLDAADENHGRPGDLPEDALLAHTVVPCSHNVEQNNVAGDRQEAAQDVEVEGRLPEPQGFRQGGTAAGHEPQDVGRLEGPKSWSGFDG